MKQQQQQLVPAAVAADQGWCRVNLVSGADADGGDGGGALNEAYLIPPAVLPCALLITKARTDRPHTSA
jgi:hypothetical protein